MNNSGIKRGLAATAISALAVTGLPLLATPASAADGADSGSVEVRDIYRIVDRYHEDISPGTGTPGRPVAIEVDVLGGDAGEGAPVGLSDVPVDVSATNGAFFTPVDSGNGDFTVQAAETDLTASGNEGGQYGEWQNLGPATQLTTDSEGNLPIAVAMERNEDFDDDGVAKTVVTIEAGDVTEQVNIVFVSIDALNVDGFEAAPTERSAADLPEVQTREVVEYDVFARDQFGNLTKQEFAGSDDTAYADVETTTSTVSYPCLGGDKEMGVCEEVLPASTQYLLDDPALTASARRGVPQSITVETAGTGNENGADADVEQPGLQPYRNYLDPTPLSAGLATIAWYVVDFAESTFLLGQEGPEANPVNAGVTEVLTALDQRGAPIRGLHVEFFRSGPSSQSGDANDWSSTNRDGRASYDFTGTRAGTAFVRAVVHEDDSRTNRLGTDSDTVRFLGQEPRVDVDADLRGFNNGARNDRPEVRAPRRAAGATVMLYKVRRDGSRKFLEQDTLDSRGDLRFTVNDANGRRRTVYQAKVVKTVDTLGDWSNRRRLR